ncbi:MAG: hypothetical protein IPG39_07995 [Bacteroidetes bacterium]|nr:hypothetical protein [Bacteroidota bacterium]
MVAESVQHVASISKCTGFTGVISGPITVCTGEQGLTYSIAAMFGASSYTWVVPAGSSIIAGQGTASIIVDWGTTSGLVTVTATNSCGVSGTRTLNVIVNCKLSENEIPGIGECVSKSGSK